MNNKQTNRSIKAGVRGKADFDLTIPMKERRLHRIVRQIEEGMKGKVKFGNGIVVQAFMELFTHLPAALQDAMNRKSTMAGYENSGIAGYGTTHTRLHTRTHIHTHTHMCPYTCTPCTHAQCVTQQSPFCV